MEDQTACMYRTQTPTGGRSSDMRMIISSTCKMVNLYMLRMKKKESLLPWKSQRILSNKNGLFSILINKKMKIPRASMKNMDSISIDHSILDQECHSKELLNA